MIQIHKKLNTYKLQKKLVLYIDISLLNFKTIKTDDNMRIQKMDLAVIIQNTISHIVLTIPVFLVLIILHKHLLYAYSKITNKRQLKII